MTRKSSIQVVQGIFLFFIVLVLCVSWGQSAESTADVSADAALKEKVRQQILGTPGQQPVDSEYIIGYRDILHVSVYGEGSMIVGEGILNQAAIRDRDGGGGSGTSFIRGRGTGVEVRIDGRVSLRHIGDVTVVGMTLTQVADYLKQLYSTIYAEPSLTVTLVQSNSKQYTVMGQVLNPGLYHLDFSLTIVRAVARAGGFTEWANSDITVIRQYSEDSGAKKEKGQKGKTFKFDFDDFLKGQGLEKNILIKSGDVIVVH